MLNEFKTQKLCRKRSCVLEWTASPELGPGAGGVLRRDHRLCPPSPHETPALPTSPHPRWGLLLTEAVLMLLCGIHRKETLPPPPAPGPRTAPTPSSNTPPSGGCRGGRRDQRCSNTLQKREWNPRALASPLSSVLRKRHPLLQSPPAIYLHSPRERTGTNVSPEPPRGSRPSPRQGNAGPGDGRAPTGDPVGCEQG